MVNNNPLWRFALEVYPEAKPTLLEWQDRHGAHVNDILWLAHALNEGVAVDWTRWRRVETGKPRELLRRIRRLRQRMRSSEPERKLALTWELELEAIDLCLLHSCLNRQRTLSRTDIDRLARIWSVKEPALTVLIEQLAGGKGGKRG